MWIIFRCATTPFFDIFLGRECFDPLVFQWVLIGLQLLLLLFHTLGGGHKAPSKAFLLDRVFGYYEVLRTEALLLHGFRHIIIVSHFKEVVGIQVLYMIRQHLLDFSGEI